MSRQIILLAATLLFAAGSASAQAQAVMPPVANPVDHPLVGAHPVRTAGAWRKGMEGFGESFVRASLQDRGYEVLDMKLPGNRGIDLFAVKRNSTGTKTDILLVEVKAHNEQSIPRLGQTRAGKQMSRQWLDVKLRDLRSHGKQGRELAFEISRFRKAQGIPLERLGEVHEINLRTGKYIIRDPISMAERAGPLSIERQLNKVALHSPQPATQAWAMRHLAEYSQLREARMGHWLSASPATRALDRVSSTQITLLEEKQALRGARRGLGQTVGRVAVVAAIAMDTYEIYGHVEDYRLGKTSKQEFIIAVTRSGGGIAGAWAGGVAGAWVGVQLGAFGGPWAWVTVPLGSFIGGTVGAVGGYYGGAYAGEAAAQAWYGSLDRNVRDQVSRWVVETPTPIGY